jgi:hypothetical protein
MEDVTSLLTRYRECVRHVWNTYYEPLQDPEAVSTFWALEDELFQFLVVWQLGRPTDQERVTGQMPFGTPDMGFGSAFIPYLRIVPQDRIIEMLVQDEIASNAFASTAVRFQTDQIDLRFIGYFDWETQVQRDWQYYRAHILRYPAQPELEGKTTFLEVRDCTVVFLETDEERMPLDA